MKRLIKIFAIMLISVSITTATGISFASIESAQNTISQLDKAGIDDNTDPEIKKLYEELSANIKEAEQLRQTYESDLRDNAQAMKDKEQSTTNKLIGAAGIGATGIGAMQAASAMAEQNADEDAESAMRAYLATFTCDYGGGVKVAGGDTGIELPGGNDLFPLRNEYMSLVDSLKERKTALGLSPGIESEEILDISQTGLYDDESIGKTGGAYASLSRALSDSTSADAAAIAQQESDTASKLKTGATVAAVGAAGSLVANLVANKDAPKEQSASITNKYQTEKDKLETQINDTESRLNAAIDANKQKIDEYNKLLAAHKSFVDSIRGTECAQELTEYIAYIDSLSPIENELQSTENLEIKYDLATQQQIYQQCVDLNKQRDECIANPTKEWIDNKCVDRVLESQDDEEEIIAAAPLLNSAGSGGTESPTMVIDATETEDTLITFVDEDQCPAKNPRLSTITDKNRVGDFCSYGNVATGHITKVKSGNDKGTCTCTADSCNTGYELKNYKCEKIPGLCEETYIDLPASSASSSYQTYQSQLMPIVATAQDDNACITACEEYAKKQNCKSQGRNIYDETKKQCRCNYSPLCTESSYAYSTATSKVSDTNGKTSLEVCNAFCQAQADSSLCTINGTVRYENDKCICNYRDRTTMAAGLKYYNVCKGDKSPTGTSKCVKGVFNWTNVQLLQARQLAAEYALIKDNTEVNCRNSKYTEYNDDYIQCSSYNGKYFYDFQFDDVKESIDIDIQSSTKQALCEKIYNGSYNNSNCGKISETDCTGKFATSAAKFGYSAVWQYGACAIISRNEPLKTVDGIDSYVFYTGIQIQANGTIVERLREYVRRMLGSVQQFDCDANPRQASKIEGHSVKGTTDDILRCKINANQDVDFVFDDMSELSNTLSKGGYQNIDCKVVGGEYNGRDCMYLTKPQCEELAKTNIDGCPTCDTIYWDIKDQVCRLPSAEDATQLEKNINQTLIVGGAVAGILITVATGGTAAPALALLAVETAGAAVEYAANDAIYKKVREFLANSQKCKDATCAEQMLKTNLQAMADFANDVPDSEVNGIDAELARLAGLIPPDSQFYQDMLANGSSTAANNKGLKSWQPEEIWRMAGVTLQLASVIKSVVGWTAKKLTKTTTVLRNGVDNASTNASRIIGDGTPPRSGPSGAGTADNAASGGRSGASGADDAAHGRTGQNTGNTSGAGASDNTASGGRSGASGADDASNGGTGQNTGNTSGAGASDNTSSGGRSGASGADDASNGGTGQNSNNNTGNAGGANNANRTGTQSIHSDLADYFQDPTNAKKRKLLLKYHPDRVPDSLKDSATEITKNLNNVDNLDDAEKIHLSELMRQFDSAYPGAHAVQEAELALSKMEDLKKVQGAEQQTRAAKEVSDYAERARQAAAEARSAGAIQEAERAEEAARQAQSAADAILNNQSTAAQGARSGAGAADNASSGTRSGTSGADNAANGRAGQNTGQSSGAGATDNATSDVPGGTNSTGNTTAGNSGTTQSGTQNGTAAQSAGANAANNAISQIDNKLAKMKTDTGLDDLIAVPADKNSAGIDQYRLLVASDENADDIVKTLQGRGINAGKIYVNSKSGGQKIYVAITDNADDYAKLKPYVQPPKNFEKVSGTVTVPDYKEPINLDVIKDAELRSVYQKAYDAEKVITNDMVEAARNSGGEMWGLEYRMKTPESMMEKIARDRKAGEVAKGISDAEVASGFSDIVRYTQTGSTETLTQQVRQTLSELEAKGYKINKVKNRFDTAAGEYKDMMVQLEHSQTGQKVELQFNTPKNLELKEKGHKFYEITRDITKTPEEKSAAQMAMEEIYKQLEVPNGIIGFTY